MWEDHFRRHLTGQRVGLISASAGAADDRNRHGASLAQHGAVAPPGVSNSISRAGNAYQMAGASLGGESGGVSLLGDSDTAALFK